MDLHFKSVADIAQLIQGRKAIAFSRLVEQEIAGFTPPPGFE